MLQPIRYLLDRPLCFRPERKLAGSDFHRRIKRALQGTHTNHLERALRPIPLGRKNWMFCWSEVGAEAVATLQSLIVTCRLHDIDPYHYLVDVLQRIDRHPAAEVHLLIPRLWRQRFADTPLRSDLHSPRG